MPRALAGLAPRALGVTPAAPSGVSPNTGSAGGGQSVTVTGTGFTGATSATLGGAALTSFVVVNDTTITGVTAQLHGFPGNHTVDLVVHKPGGDGTDVNAYVYQERIDSISPNIKYDFNVDGTAVTITGIGFNGLTIVDAAIGVYPGAIVNLHSVVIVNDTTITAVLNTPALLSAAPTPFDVIIDVSNAGGYADVGLALFTVWSPSVMSGVLVFLRDGNDYIYLANFDSSQHQGTWTDRGGGGNDFTHAMAATGTPSPATGINGRATVHFTFDNSESLAGPNFFNFVTRAEAFIVTKNSADRGFPTLDALWDMGSAGTYGAYYPFSGSMYESFGRTTRLDAFGAPPTLSDAHCYNVRAHNDGSYEVDFDGAALLYSGGAGSNTVAFPTAPRIGQNKDPAFYDGDVGSLLIFNRVLLDAERDGAAGSATVFAYFRAMWGTP